MVRVSASALAITLVSVMVQTAADICTDGLTSEATCGTFDGGKCRWYSDNTCHEECFHPNIAYIEVPPLAATTVAADQDACKTLCHFTPNCAKFSYRTLNKHCTLYTDSATRGVDTDIVSGSVDCAVHIPGGGAAQAPCTLYPCPPGYVRKTPTDPLAPPLVCLTAPCSIADDRDSCCSAQPTQVSCAHVCHGHGFNQQQCEEILGCEFDDSDCWSSVGDNPCPTQAPTPTPTQAPTPTPTRGGTAPTESMPANIVNAMRVAQANTGMSFSGLSSRSRGLVPEEGGTIIAVIVGGGAITAVVAAITLMSRRSRESISTQATVAEE